MRDPKLWASDLLQCARTNPSAMVKLVEQIQTEASHDGFTDAMSTAISAAQNSFSSLDVWDPLLPPSLEVISRQCE